MNGTSRWARAWRRLLRRWFPDRRTTEMVIREIRDREIRTLLDGSAMAALVAAQHPAPSGRVVDAHDTPWMAPHRNQRFTGWLGSLGSGYRDEGETDDELAYLRGWWDEDWMEAWPSSTIEDETGSSLEPHDWGGGFGNGDAWDLYQDDWDGMGSGMGCCDVNPATGLPMLDDGGVDVGGNPYGVDWQD